MTVPDLLAALSSAWPMGPLDKCTDQNGNVPHVVTRSHEVAAIGALAG